MGQKSILLVEDETLIRMMLAEMVEELGHKVVAAAANIAEGCSLAKSEQYDLAILDINLQGKNVQPVAEAVKARGIPLFFLSGYGQKGVPQGFEERIVVTKPCIAEVLGRTIDHVLAEKHV